MDKLALMREALYNGDAGATREMTLSLLEEGLSAKTILDEGLIEGMDQVGKDFRNGDLFIPEVLIAAEAMKASMEVLRPLFAETGYEPIGRVVIGTVKGDLHDIGKNLVGMMLEGAGFEVLDLGIDAEPAKFVEAVEKSNPNIVGMSALLTTTMSNMKGTISALAEAGLRDRVKVMVGGAPLTAKFAQDIDADGFAPDASHAVELARDLMGSSVKV